MDSNNEPKKVDVKNRTCYYLVITSYCIKSCRY